MNKKDKNYIESLIGDMSGKMPDYDGDGYPDLFDCDPFDPTKDGLVGDAWKRMTGAAERAQRSARRIYTPAATRARQSTSQAMARVRESAAAAQRAVTSHRRAGVERAAAIRARPPPKPRVDIVKTYKETERRVSEKIPTLHEIAMAGGEFGERPAVQRAYQDIGRQVLRLPKPIKAAGVETFKFTRGSYKEFQQYPVTTAAKTAAFALAGPALRGVGVAATAGRAAIAARAPMVARIPAVGKALVTTGEKAAWVGEKAAKYAMPAMGVLWAGSIGHRLYKTPEQLRSEEAGRIFASEVVPMAGGAAIAQEAAMFTKLGIPRWKAPSIKKVKDWKPPAFEKPPAAAELPPTLRPPKPVQPLTIEPITIAPKPGVSRNIQLRNELIELEARPPRGSALFGTKAEKSAWSTYNKKVSSIKSEIKKTELKEITSAREKELAEAEKWAGAEREWVTGTGVAITPPKPLGPLSQRVQLNRQLIDLEAAAPRGSRLYGTSAQKKAFKSHDKKVSDLKKKIKEVEAKETKPSREKELAEQEKWEAAEAKDWLESGRPAMPPRPSLPPLAPKIKLRNQLIELEGTPPRGSALFGTKAQKAAWSTYNKKVSTIKKKIKDIDAREAKESAAAREKELTDATKWREAEAEFVTKKEPIAAVVRKVKKELPVRKPKEKTLEDEWKAAEATYKEQFEAPTPVSAVVKEPSKPKDVFAEAKKASEGRVKKRLAEEKRLKDEFGDVAMGGAPGRHGSGQQLLLKQEVKAVQKVKTKQEVKAVQKVKTKQEVKAVQKVKTKQEQRYKLMSAGEQMTRTMQATATQRQKQLADMMKPAAMQKQKPDQAIVPLVGYKPLYDVPQVPREVAIPKVTQTQRVDQAQKYRHPPPTPGPKPKQLPRPKVFDDPPPPPPRITDPPPPPPFLPFMMGGGMGGGRALSGKRKRAWKQKEELLTLEDFLGYKP